MELALERARWFERMANPPRMVLTERDRQILTFAHHHRLLNTEHVFTLLGATTPGQVRKVRKRLRLLFDHGLLDVPRLQTLDHRRTGSVPKVYALSRKGAREINRSWGVVNQELGRPFFKHTLMVTSIMVALERGAADLQGLRVVPFSELLERAPEETKNALYLNRWDVDVSSREAAAITWTETMGVTPDKIFALEFKKAGKTGRFLLFLEADRGTEPIIRTMTERRGAPKPKQLSSIYRKLLAYKASFNEKIAKRYGFTNGFRVLFVTNRPGRVSAMADATKTLAGSRRMFLFANEEELLSDNPLTAWWQNGHGEAVQLVDSVV